MILVTPIQHFFTPSPRPPEPPGARQGHLQLPVGISVCQRLSQAGKAVGADFTGLVQDFLDVVFFHDLEDIHVPRAYEVGHVIGDVRSERA